MTRNVLCGGIVLGLVVAAGRADAAPAIAIDPNPIGFGGNGMLYNGGIPGEQQFGYYVITNVGTTTLSVTDMAITGPDAGLIAFDDPLCPWGTDCPQPFTVTPGEQRWFSLTCVTVQPGTFSASLTVTSDATSGTSSVPITCLGLYPPQLQIVPSGLDFGTTHSCWYGDSCGPSCNTQPLTQTLTITNAAPAPSEVDVSMVLPLSAPYEDFTIEGAYGWPTPLAAGQALQLTLSFHPAFSKPQFYDAPLTLTSTYPAGLAPIDIPFHAHGGGGWLVVDTPPQLGVVPIGQTLTTTITVHNAGNSCLYLNEVYPSGDLTVLAPDPSTALLQAGESFTWTVACTPSPQTPGGAMSFYYIFEGVDEPATYQFYCHSETGMLFADPAQAAFTGTREVGVGMSGTQRLRVENVGSQPTDLVAMTSSDPHFTVALASGSLPVTLAPGDETQIDVSFTPTDTTHVTGTIVLDASIGTGFTVTTVGDGAILAASVVPSSHDFGSVVLPAMQSQDFQLHNTGERTLTVDAVSLDLPNDYALIGLAAGATIDPGATLAFTVRATPSTLGQRHATLAIDLDRASDLAIPLDAIASDPVLVVATGDPSPADYALELGSVDVDVGPKTGHVTLHNAGSAAITLATCAVAGDPAFTLATACPLTLAAAANADLAVAFAPTAEADSIATLTVTGTGFATGALRIGLHGTGVDQHVALSATSIGFPDTFRHPTSAMTQVVTVRNTATAELVCSTITVDGAGFALVGPATATLAPGEAADLTIGFAPAAIGDFTGHLVIGNADDPQIARVSLTGRGIARDLAIAPLAIDLGTVTVGTTVRLGDLQPDAIAIRNADAAAAFTISSVTLSGDPAFRLIGPDRTVLAPGERARLDLELTAATPGALAAQIAVFVDGDPDPSAQIAVTANAVAPPSTGGGCGCTTGGPASTLPFALGVALLVLRRRR